VNTEQVALLAYAKSGWTGARLITDTDAGIRQDVASMSGGCGGDWSYDTTTRGVHGTRAGRPRHLDDSGNRIPEVTVTWTELRTAVRSLPAATVTAVRAAYDEWHRWYMRYMTRPYRHDGAAAPWVPADPQLLSDAETRMRDAVAAAWALLVPAEQTTLW
jgi:hypothetical protein